MASNKKPKTVYFLITETEIYRTDYILKQIDEWITAFVSGRIVRAPYPDENSLDEFEAHLQKTADEIKKLIKNDTDHDDYAF